MERIINLFTLITLFFLIYLVYLLCLNGFGNTPYIRMEQRKRIMIIFEIHSSFMHGNLGKGDESRHGAEVAQLYGVQRL